MIQAKISNAAGVLQHLQKHNPDTGGGNRVVAEAVALLEREAEGVGGATTIESLDGHEGVAAREYFSALMQFNRSGLEWPGRRKHPSEDPLNALLSLAYTLIMQETSSLLEGLGLDPFLGFLHQLDYGRPSLALDVMEPFRNPVADRLVLRLANKHVISEDDFERRDGRGGIFLKPAGMVRFFEGYEKWMTLRTGDKPCFRDLLKGSCERMARCLRDGEPKYEAFSYLEAHEDWNTLSVTI